MRRRGILAAGGAAVVAMLGGSQVQRGNAMPSLPPSVPDLSRGIMSVADRSQLTTEMRVGKVVYYDTSRISVLIGGAVLPGCAYLRSYQPILGDYVVLVHQDSQWVVTNALAGNPPTNVVTNWSFESDLVGASPLNWARYHSGTSTANNVTMAVQSNFGSHPISGNQAIDLSIQDTSGVGNQYSLDYVYSDPFNCIPNETWAVSCWIKYQTSQSFGLVSPQANVSVGIWWFADATTVPPSGVSTTGYSPAMFGAAHPSWIQLTNPAPNVGNVVPSGASYGRVVVRCETNISSASSSFADIWIDLVIAQKIKNADGSYAP